MKTNIIYEDKEMIVIHKPAGIATQTNKLGQADVVSELKNYLHRSGQGSYVGVIHRLDQPVEGLLVFAKTPQAAKNLSAQLQNGALKKSYSALVPEIDAPLPQEGELTDYLVKDARTNLSRVVDKSTPDAKEARLKWICKQTICGQDLSYSLVDVEIFTGRHHQIRVQMSHAGMPLLGDSKYGNEASKALTQKLGLHQTALLARTLTVKHPVTKELMSFELPYPLNWKIT